MAVLQSLVDCKLLELTTDGVSVREGGERKGRGRRIKGEGSSLVPRPNITQLLVDYITAMRK